MEDRRVPRPFALPWGSGHVMEEATVREGVHEPSIQLLRYEKGPRRGQTAIRFAAYSEAGELERRPLIVNERELPLLRGELLRSPRLRALLRRLVEES